MIHFGLFEMRLEYFVLLSFVVYFSVQLLLCFKVKNRWLRLLPLFVAAIALLVFAVLAFLFDDWDRLGFVLLAIFAAILLLSCVLALAAFWLIRRICRHKNTDSL